MESARTIGCEDVVEQRCGEFVVSTDRARLDLDVIHGFLTNCYWAKGIRRELVARALENSLCFGIYDGGKSPLLPKPGRSGAPPSVKVTPVQVGFARVISDFATFAYLADVFVLESHRGRGLGKALMECIKQHPALQGLRRWSLSTKDAHQLYAQYGFTPLQWPERYMEILRPNMYQTE